ncbi:hypothetical protein D6810_00550 [Candidatus Dojkabacteria bacterium]|uniref:PEGA domain-containing protein n=1 Tax=Candidatus Dojkabacteria bacterium TaxID=2099670 RepID=A0A3M0Z1N3_9BACT|nr:MAG: hypothetical protein D6810_00550 [Candidatus Dojkabacteria bacterium]
MHFNLDFGTVLGLNKPENISGLQVYSLNGSIDVFVDDVKIGKATKDSPLIYDRIVPGKRRIKLIRSDLPTGLKYWVYSNTVEFIRSTSVVVSFNLGPTERVSEGQLIYTVPKKDPNANNKVRLNFKFEGFSVSIDGSPFLDVSSNFFETVFNTNTQKRFRVTKLGYEPIEFVLLPSTQEERSKLDNFDLVVDIILMQKILPVENL